MNNKSCLYKENVISGLGLFTMQVESTGGLLSVESTEDTISICSTGYDVTLKRVNAPTDWLPAGMSVDTAKGWLFYIAKKNEIEQQLTISFKLLHKLPSINSSADTGQWLSAIEFEDGVRQLHIGTQDEEWFSWYGKHQWMPERLVSALDKHELLITEIDEGGLKTKVPALFAGERFYIHYVLAESPRRKSIQYPDEWDVSTWYAVDQSQQSLEEAWNKQAEV
jgi:hypothetical protein